VPMRFSSLYWKLWFAATCT